MQTMMPIYSAFAILAMTITIVYGQQTAHEPYKQCTKPGYVALIFDDGPSSYTPLLLDELKQENVTATFFVFGTRLNNKNLSEYTKQAFDKGHQIASHTMRRLYLPDLSDNDLQREVQKAEQSINKTIGYVPNYIR
jgi:peptidoglycan/xylan/chitin deacetylase (PgdA/CDA1 family)